MDMKEKRNSKDMEPKRKADNTLYRIRVRPLELFLSAFIYGAASLSVFLLLGMIGYIFFKGYGELCPDFFTNAASARHGTVGIGGNLLNTAYLIVSSLLIGIPVGVGAAIYLNEYAAQGRLISAVEFAIETLAGIPSILFGMFGMVFFGGVLGLGYSLLNGALTLTLMILSLIVQNTRDALRAVPNSYREGAVGMGAAKWHMIQTVLLPSAAPGILTGIILAVGRIVGESAALLFTAGSAGALPKLGQGVGEDIAELLGKIFESGGTLAIALYLQMQNGEYELAFGIGCVLIFVVLLMNWVISLIGAKKR